MTQRYCLSTFSCKSPGFLYWTQLCAILFLSFFLKPTPVRLKELPPPHRTAFVQVTNDLHATWSSGFQFSPVMCVIQWVNPQPSANRLISSTWHRRPFSPPCCSFPSGFWGAGLAWMFLPHWFLLSQHGIFFPAACARWFASGLLLDLFSLYIWWSFMLKV